MLSITRCKSPNKVRLSFSDSPEAMSFAEAMPLASPRKLQLMLVALDHDVLTPTGEPQPVSIPFPTRKLDQASGWVEARAAELDAAHSDPAKIASLRDMGHSILDFIPSATS